MDPHRLPNWFRMLVFLLLFIIAVLTLPALYLGRQAPEVEQVYGVSFSSKQARSLGLDAKQAYLAMLDELKVKNIRLAAYWDEIEPASGQLEFSELDWQLDEAAKRDAKVVLAIGRKLPRWPECFYAEWARGESLDKENEHLLVLIRTLVERYNNHPALRMWQLENEPFVGWFGDCPKPDSAFLKKELALVRSLSDKQILITDSGELSTWRKSARFADRFGTTLYRETWNPYLGYGTYPLPAGSYRLKARLWGLEPKDVIIAELQAEPWPPGTSVLDTSLEEQFKTMSLDRFNKQIAFAQSTGFGEAYLWGVEWWYWMKTTQNHPEFWFRAKELFVVKQ